MRNEMKYFIIVRDSLAILLGGVFLFCLSHAGCSYTFYSGPGDDASQQDASQQDASQQDGGFDAEVTDGATDTAVADGQPTDGPNFDAQAMDAAEQDASGEYCGNGETEGDEECDDGANGDPCDGCLDDCTLHVNECGDGYICGSEECDDANENGQDGCTKQCNISSGFRCSGEPSLCWEYTLNWVAIVGNVFDMGSNVQTNEAPVHTVTVPSFEITKSEITVTQYAECVLDTQCTAPATSSALCTWDVLEKGGHPVNCVTWQQAVTFCTWAGGRLPSEAEWEFAARSQGTADTYPWGDDTASCDYAIMNAGGDGCGTGETWEVCSKPDGNSVQGLCDMSGNVWEWVQDWYHSDYVGAPIDGSAWESPAGVSRVVRGGSLADNGEKQRARYRSSQDPSSNTETLGFRCVQ